jgi:hypothetical protein
MKIGGWQESGPDITYASEDCASTIEIIKN